MADSHRYPYRLNQIFIFVQQLIVIFNSEKHVAREFNGSVNISESYDFRSQLLLLNVIFQPSFLFMFWIFNKQIRNFKDWPKRVWFQIEETECLLLWLVEGGPCFQ